MPVQIIITEFMDESAVRWLRERFSVRYEPDLHAKRTALIQALSEADALIVRNRTQVDAELLGHQTRLRAIGRLGVGLENIDVEYCRKRHIEVLPALGANAAAVAEYVITCAMVLLRPVYFSTSAVADGVWPREKLSDGREAGGKMLGIVGYGSVGRITADLGRALGMQVIAYDPALDPSHNAWQAVRRCSELDDLMREADIVSLHVPLMPATRNLIDARRIGLMRLGAILINVARGGIVDEAALAGALAGGRLGGAAVDVYTEEPLPPGSALAGIPNLILTPHIAGVTTESNARVSSMIAHRIADCINKAHNEET